MRPFTILQTVITVTAVLSLPLCMPLAPAMAAETGNAGSPQKAGQSKTYHQDEVLKEAEAFFGKGAEGMGDAIAKVFKEKGEPNGYIKGEEAGGAIGVGVRYGRGDLQLRGGATRKVYWQGPSIGFDLGGKRGQGVRAGVQPQGSGDAVSAVSGGGGESLLHRGRGVALPAQR